jgi:hypothetical protein
MSNFHQPGDVHVDLMKADPASSGIPSFLRRLALDDPLMIRPDGQPTQMATGGTTYYDVSQPHTMGDCPFADPCASQTLSA